MFNPDKQFDLCKNSDDCFFGEYPTLARINAEYYPNASVEWLNVEIYNISEFCGCRDKITPQQVYDCSRVITATFYYLKISELMLFFFQFKSGKYGKFYGSVDPMVITSSLRDFLRERGNAYFDYENEKDKKDAMNIGKNAVTYEQYKKMIGQ